MQNVFLNNSEILTILQVYVAEFPHNMYLASVVL